AAGIGNAHLDQVAGSDLERVGQVSGGEGAPIRQRVGEDDVCTPCLAHGVASELSLDEYTAISLDVNALDLSGLKHGAHRRVGVASLGQYRSQGGCDEGRGESHCWRLPLRPLELPRRACAG